MEHMQQVCDEVVHEYAMTEGGLLPCLHAIQQRLGYVPELALPIIAEGFRLSRAEVHGVISFYHDFRSKPGAATTVQICCGEACQSVGSRALEAAAPELMGVEFNGDNPGGRFRLERVYCLGNCACGPSVRIGDRIHGRVSPNVLSSLLITEGTD